MEELKTLLGEELFAQISEKLGETKVVTYTGKEAPVPYATFKEANEAKNVYKSQADEFQGQLSSLNDKLKTFEGVDPNKMNELTSQISDFETQLENKNKELTNLTKSTLLKDAFGESKVKDKFAKLFMKEFDFDLLNVEEGKLSGHTDILKGLQESYPEGFGEIIDVQSAQVTTQTNNAASVPDSLYTIEQINSMNEKEMETNWDMVEKSLKALQ